MLIITESFIRQQIESGGATQAQLRIRRGEVDPNTRPKSRRSTWQIICDEMVDTEIDPRNYDTNVANLLRRGYSFQQIDEMRRFAWRTIGWVNFDCVLWEWVSLDESHICKALELQLERRHISEQQHQECVAYLADPTRRAPDIRSPSG